MNSRTTYQVPGQPRLDSKTVSQKQYMYLYIHVSERAAGKIATLYIYLQCDFASVKYVI